MREQSGLQCKCPRSSKARNLNDLVQLYLIFENAVSLHWQYQLHNIYLFFGPKGHLLYEIMMLAHCHWSWGFFQEFRGPWGESAPCAQAPPTFTHLARFSAIHSYGTIVYLFKAGRTTSGWSLELWPRRKILTKWVKPEITATWLDSCQYILVSSESPGFKKKVTSCCPLESRTISRNFYFSLFFFFLASKLPILKCLSH